MDEISSKDVHIGESRKDARYFVAVAWGLLMGGLTFAAGPLAWSSANPVIAALQFALTMLLLPGLYCAATGGSLVPGAFVNGLFHLGAAWLVLTIIARVRRRAKARL